MFYKGGLWVLSTLIFSKNTTKAFCFVKQRTTSLINNGWSFLEPSNLIYKWQNRNCHLGLSNLTLLLLLLWLPMANGLA